MAWSQPTTRRPGCQEKDSRPLSASRLDHDRSGRNRFGANPSTTESAEGHGSGRADLVCFGKIVVELKAVKAIAPEHEAQLLNYLKATGMKLGLLVNFGSYPNAEVERRIL